MKTEQMRKYWELASDLIAESMVASAVEILCEVLGTEADLNRMAVACGITLRGKTPKAEQIVKALRARAELLNGFD